MMLTALIIIFVLAYAAIAFEHPLKVNKSASALIGMAWSHPPERHPLSSTVSRWP